MRVVETVYEFGELVKGSPKSEASKPGASLGELMNRMGHSSTRAARIYLHAREERDRQLAAALDRMARQ